MEDIIVTPKNWEFFLKSKKNEGGIQDEDIENVCAEIEYLEDGIKKLKGELVKLYKRIDTMGGGMDSTLFKIDENFIKEILELLFHARIINQDIIDVDASEENTGYNMDVIKEKSKKIDAVIKKMHRLQYSDGLLYRVEIDDIVNGLLQFKDFGTINEKLKKFMSDEFGTSLLRDVKRENWSQIKEFLLFQKQKEDLENLIKNR